MNNSDSDMIQRTLDGDQQAFTELVEKYQKQVHALVWQKIGDFHIAQEITQDVFLSAFHKLSTLKHHNRLAGWLYVIADNKCKNWFRKKQLAYQSLEETDPGELEEVFYSEYMTHQREEAANRKRRGIVQKLLSTLQESDRTVVNLYYIAEMSCEDIGKFLGVSPNTVRSRLHRARNRLKKEESIIQENLSSFQLPTQMTEHIMEKVSRLMPSAPSANKPYIPLAISAASAILVVLLLGVGTKNLMRFQQPYSLTAQSEPTIEIVDAPIVLESTVKPANINQVSRSNVLSKNDGTGQKLDALLFAAAQSDEAEISKSKREWRQTNGPYGGNIRTLFATSDGILLAGTINQGIFRSTDLGDSWSPANVGLSASDGVVSVSVLTFAQIGDTIYASMPVSLIASTDNGKTWSTVPNYPQNDTITDFVSIGDRLYISAYPGDGGVGGVWYTDDEKSWIPMNDGLTNLSVREFANIGTTLVVGTADGAFRKKDTEDSWAPIHSGLSKSPSSSGIIVDAIAVLENLLFLGVRMGKNGGLFRSDDEGDSWTRISTKKMGSSTYALTVSESTLYACAGGNVFRSDDKGDSWIHVSKGMPDRAGAGLVAISADTVFVSTTHQEPRQIIKSDFSASTVFVPTFEGSIFRTTDAGNSWVEANIGIMHSSVVDLEVLGNRIYAFTGNRLFFSDNGGETWERIENSQKPFLFRFSSISALNGKLYVGATRFSDKSYKGAVGGVFQLDEQSNSLIEVKIERKMYAIECMHIVGTTFYVGTQGQGVFLWNEGWDKWLNIGLEDKVITDISVSEANIYARTQKDGIYRLDNHQKPWDLIKEDKETLRLFAQSRKIGGRRFVLSKKVGLMRSEDGGNTWTQLYAGLEIESWIHHLINPHELITTVEIDDTGFYIGTSQNEIFKWNHKDERWEQLGSLSRPVQSLAVLNGVLYAGTGAGVHRIQ